ncbi:hypothetical protein [Sphingomonas sp. SRS2]|uniref:hypothetical protein n=1 Tax=Sphingomonas sp. SRS2 TaxID=133190 RepID=UPI00128E7FB7|nr:hypothetical protein [Sphingomonas sp. SRS2]
MRDTLLPMFEQLNVPRPQIIWSSCDDVFSWILAWESYEQRQAGWSRVYPAWHKIKMSLGDQEFVTQTELTLIQPWLQMPSFQRVKQGSCETAWHVRPHISHVGRFREACLETVFAGFQKAGATSVAGFDMLFGPLPQMLILVSWPDPQLRQAASALSAPHIERCRGASGDLTAPALVSERSEFLDRAGYL